MATPFKMTYAPILAKRPVARRTAGFTLIELMVSVALSLILLIGVNAVFRITSDTIGSGTALNTAIRSNRETSAVLFDDLHHVVMPGDDQPNNGPFFAIRSERVAAFPNAIEEQNDRDYTRTLTGAAADSAIRSVDVNGNGTEGEVVVATLDENSPATALDSRNHRIDQICFFARGQFRRQTANDSTDTFVANQTTPEAWIWYGHLKQPDGSLNMATALNPGEQNAGTNPNNAYARNWILGRMVTCLAEPISPAPGSPSRVVLDAADTTRAAGAQRVAQEYIGRAPNADNTILSPLIQGSRSTPDGQRFNATQIQWARFDVAGTTINQFRGILTNSIFVGNNTNWWNEFPYRFSGYPKPNRPLDVAGLARTVPCMIPGCTQFVVEYAGDFIVQDGNGNFTSAAKRFQSAADGITDYYIDGNGIAKTRWYGFPRDTNGDGKIPSKNLPASQIADVVPLRDIAGAQAFERDFPNWVPEYTAAGAIATGARYQCVWGPDTIGYPVPKMIRFVVTVDDPAGRMTSPQTYEYVVEIP